MAHTHKRPKRQLFKAYIESILFLYNCEIWTMSKSRKKLTKLKKKKMMPMFILNVKRLDVITNSKMYKTINWKELERWSRICKKRLTK